MKCERKIYYDQFLDNPHAKQQRTQDLTYVLDFHVASIELHSNQIWRDLREFYSLVGVFEKILKI